MVWKTQTTSQALFEMITVCLNTSFESCSPLVNGVVHTLCWNSRHVLTSRCRYSTICRGLESCTLAPASRTRCGSRPGSDQSCWLATCQDWWTLGSLVAQKFDRLTSTVWWPVWASDKLCSVCCWSRHHVSRDQKVTFLHFTRQYDGIFSSQVGRFIVG